MALRIRQAKPSEIHLQTCFLFYSASKLRMGNLVAQGGAVRDDSDEERGPARVPQGQRNHLSLVRSLGLRSLHGHADMRHVLESLTSSMFVVFVVRTPLVLLSF